MTSSTPSPPEAPPPAEAAPAPPLRRSRGHKVVAGVCGGLGRHFDLDPVIFRVALGVLAVTGGVGLLFYGFAWLLVPLAGEEESEGRRLLTGRVSGSSLTAVLTALVGSGVFLSMLHNGGTLAFALVLSVALSGAAVWSQRRPAVAATAEEGGRIDAAAALAVAEAPPETKAPPLVEFPSWWRDPIVKDGSTGKVATGYLWGPHGVLDEGVGIDGAVPTPGGPWGPPGGPPQRPTPSTRVRTGPPSIGGLVFLLALVAGGLGTGLSWHGHPLGTSLQIGLVAALAVFGLGLVVSSLIGRTGFGTVFLTIVTAGLLAGASALPKEISTEWIRETWRPAAVAAVQPRYELGLGVGTLDLSGLAVPAGTTVVTQAEVGAGRLKVIVPKGVTLKVRAQVGLGDIQWPQQQPPAAPTAPAPPATPGTPATGSAASGQPVQPPSPAAPQSPPSPSPQHARSADDIDIEPDLDETRTFPPSPGVTPGGTLDLFLKVGAGQVEVIRAGS
ncbi:PspC domain-containing protein [Streptomyces showdoensis]|uniref:Membrane protein n=1 Tax=Streptomyces showdoensis TaxID=68268 RepID=A0A2P2GDE1_STREW|nr:PspC domain-containing protein [Streptomyces showdoensis]KKZ69524.1 membrane protein [Streptomyces showdoensis]